jgi:hypothetical protein
LSSALATLGAERAAFAYRTSEDSPTFRGDGPISWQEGIVSFALSDRDLPAGISKSDVESALASSLDTWNAPACSAQRVAFTGWVPDAPAAKDGTNTIAWVADWQQRDFPVDAPGNTDVQYRGSDNDWRIAEADIYLNAVGFDWVSTNPGKKQTLVEAVLTHELGHALGLLHPCEPGGADEAPACEATDASVAETTMYPFYSPEQVSLADDDVAGLCYLYGQVDECGGACTARELCMAGECRAVCHDLVCEPGQECGSWGCVPKGGCTARYCEGQSCSPELEGACGPLARCSKDGLCASGKVNWGDGCSTSADCKRGACVDGVCQPDCAQDTECAPLGQCVATEDGSAQGCVDSSQYEQGFTCKMGEDCESHVCIFMGKRAQCTNDCKSDDACLSGWSCREVEKRNVCVPPEYSPGGGCAFSSKPQDGETWSAVFGLLLLAAVRRGLRKQYG